MKTIEINPPIEIFDDPRYCNEIIDADNFDTERCEFIKSNFKCKLFGEVKLKYKTVENIPVFEKCKECLKYWHQSKHNKVKHETTFKVLEEAFITAKTKEQTYIIPFVSQSLLEGIRGVIVDECKISINDSETIRDIKKNKRVCFRCQSSGKTYEASIDTSLIKIGDVITLNKIKG